MNPEFIQQVRRKSSQTNLQAQRIVEELKKITSKPPPDDKGGGEAEE